MSSRASTASNAGNVLGVCGASLAAFKHPRRLVLVDAIPRTGPTGQVQRRRLVERARPEATPV